MGKIYRSKTFLSSHNLDPFSWDDRPINYIEAHFDDLGRCWRIVLFGLSSEKGAPPPNDGIAKTFFTENDKNARPPMAISMMSHVTKISQIEEWLKRVPNIEVSGWEIIDY